MDNPHNLPPHLVGMTAATWDAMAPAERDAARDRSKLHPQLIGLEGKRVRVTPKREFGPSTFRVGISTGWRPCHLAMRGNAHGSSDVLSEREKFDRVEVLP